MEKYCDIGDKIKKRRLALNLTSNYVANKAGITRATLSAIENGSTKCTLNNLLKVTSFLDMKIDVISKENNYSIRKRASRRTTALEKAANRFLIFSIEQYAASINKNSSEIYNQIEESGLINHFLEFYEDLHGMSTEYLNDYISDYLEAHL